MRILVAISAMSVMLAMGISGCRIHVDKGANGEEQKVQVDTPFGGVHVNTDQTTATDLGLPVYPGAQLYRDKDKNKSADVHVGFGDWQIRVRTVSYTTSDSRDKVAAFYKQALSRYGDVLTCQGHSAVGKPAFTAEGLSCDDDDRNTKFQVKNGDIATTADLQLKAGSKRHQHIVGFESGEHGFTRFSLVALELPASMGSDSKKRD